MFVLLRVFVLCGVFDVIVKQLFEFRGILEILLCACTSIWCGWYLVFKLIELCTCNASSHTCAHTHTHTHTHTLLLFSSCSLAHLVGCRDAYVGMHQKFSNTPYWLDSEKKNDSIFFPKNLPSAATHFAMWWDHLFHYSAQINFNMSSKALVNTWHASLVLSNRVPFNCFFTSGNRKKSVGERSGKYCGCGSRCISLLLRKSIVVATVCMLALSWWNKGNRVPSLGWRCHQTS